MMSHQVKATYLISRFEKESMKNTVFKGGVDDKRLIDMYVLYFTWRKHAVGKG